MKNLRILILTIAVMALAQGASAKDVKFELNLDKDKIAIGDTAQLGLSFYSTHSMPAPDIGSIDGLDIRYLGPSTMMTVINGQVSSSITHMYKILPLKIGRFQLGPFSFRLKGDKYSSNMVFLEVVEEKVSRPAKEAPAAAENLNLEDRIFLTLDVAKPAAYANELIPVKVKLYVNRLNVSDIQLPVFEQEGFSKVEFKEPKQYREEMSGLTYDVLEFNTSIFGTRPGDYALGPAKIKCNVVVKKRTPRASSMRNNMFSDDSFNDSFFDDFFTSYERHPLELSSPKAHIVISGIPASGRPGDYQGAVGDYQFIYKANPVKLKVGDPVTVQMDINGTGNFNTVLMPRLDNLAGFKVYEPQVKTEGHTKSFTQVIIPENELVTQIPKATFSYFDPNAREYKQITRNPIPIQVEKGKEEAPSQVIGPISTAASVSQEQPKDDISRDIVYIKESPGKWLMKDYGIYRNRLFLVVFIIPILFLTALSLIQARRNKFKKDTVYAGHILALKSARAGIKGLKAHLKPADQKIFYQILFEALQGYLGNRLGIPPAGVTSSIVEDMLLPKEVELNILSKIKTLFDTCDRARFAFLQVDAFKMKDDAMDLEDIIRYFERHKI